MKTKKLFLLCLFGMIGMGASAYDFEVGGIYYDITSSTDLTCSVTYKNTSYNSYSGNVRIPDIATYNGKNYFVTSIGDHAFRSCSSLTSITIPEPVTSIGVNAFFNCINLTSVTIPELITSIGDWAFQWCSSLTSVTIPESVTSIGRYAFSYCRSLTSITIPNSVTSIGDNAFMDCINLSSVIIGNSVTSIGYCAFQGCSSLTSVTIPESVTSIKDKTFSYCSSLTSVTIGNSVTSIGSRVFLKSNSLTLVTIPVSVTSIEDDAFEDCNKVEVLYWGSNLSPWYITKYCYNSLKKIVIGGEMTTLGGSAFKNCFLLVEVEIPSSVTSIGASAFSGCSGLISTNIPAATTSIGDNAYKDCTGLVKVKIESNSLVSKDYTSSSNIKNLFSDSHVKTIILGSEVNVIGSYAFYGFSDLTSITIPKSVKSIGNNAFQYCSGLVSVTIPKKVKAISNYAFSNCSKLKTVSLPDDLKSIEDYAFNGCTALSSIIIPQGVTKIGNSGFQDCTGIASVELSEGLESIGTSAFAGCASLAALTIPSAVTTIGSNALDGCTGLKSLIIDGSISSMGTNVFNACNPTYVEINGNITSTASTFQNKTSVKEVVIGKNVNTLYNLFSGCTGLTKLTLGENLQYIRNDAFKGCTKLKEIISKNTVPPYCYPDVFSGIQTESCKLAVPSASVAAYQSEEPWNGFGTLTAYDVKTELIEITDGMEYAQSYDIAADKITYTRAFSNTSWQSIYVPFEITITDDLLNDFEFAYINGAKLYDYDDDGTPDDAKVEVFKMKSGTLLANMPYLIRAKATGTKTITVNEATLYATEENSIDCSTTALKFTFTGGYSTLGYNDIGDCYLLGGGTWNPVREGGTMKPMRFYLKIESRDFKPFKAPVIRMTVYGEDGEVTEVDAPFMFDDLQSGGEDSPYFDLQGRPVEKPERGIYIVGGKKVFVQ